MEPLTASDFRPSSPVYIRTYRLWSPRPVLHLRGVGHKLELGEGHRGFAQRSRCGLLLYRAVDGQVTDDEFTGLPWRHAARIGRLCRRCAPEGGPDA